MARKIIFYKNHFLDFYQKQDKKVKGKIQYVLEIVKQVDRVPKKFMEHLTGTDGLYEVRVEFQSNIYRIFCCFDEGISGSFQWISKENSKNAQIGTGQSSAVKKGIF